MFIQYSLNINRYKQNDTVFYSISNRPQIRNANIISHTIYKRIKLSIIHCYDSWINMGKSRVTIILIILYARIELRKSKPSRKSQIK